MNATKETASDAQLEARALAAYFRSAAREGITADQPAGGADVVEHDGLLYVVLGNARGTLAVYRVHNDGMLRRMKRWPREVAPREGE
jgi:hypothetical protein